MTDEFYVYIYRDPIDETPVYVGKGKGSRAMCHISDRARTNNRLGKLIANRTKLGLVVEPEIVAYCNERNALLIEQALISYFGRSQLSLGPLFNSTDGGDGVSNPSQEVRGKQASVQEKRWGTKTHDFINAFTNEEFTGKPVELAAKLGINQRAIHKLFNHDNIHSVAGWCLKGNERLVNAYNVSYQFKNVLLLRSLSPQSRATGTLGQ